MQQICTYLKPLMQPQERCWQPGVQEALAVARGTILLRIKSASDVIARNFFSSLGLPDCPAQAQSSARREPMSIPLLAGALLTTSAWRAARPAWTCSTSTPTTRCPMTGGCPSPRRLDRARAACRAGRPRLAADVHGGDTARRLALVLTPGTAQGSRLCSARQLEFRAGASPGGGELQPRDR